MSIDAQNLNLLIFISLSCEFFSFYDSPEADVFVINPFWLPAFGGSGLGNYPKVSCSLSLCYRKLEQKAIFMKRLESG